MNKTLKNIEQDISAYVKSLREATTDATIICIDEFMKKRSDDIVNVCKIRESISHACALWDTPIVNLAIADLSLDKYPQYNFGFDENVVSFCLLNDDYEITVSVNFKHENDSVIVTVTWAEDNDNALVVQYNTKNHTHKIINNPNMYHIKQHKTTNMYTAKTLTELTKKTLSDLDLYFDEYIEKLAAETKSFINDDEP